MQQFRLFVFLNVNNLVEACNELESKVYLPGKSVFLILDLDIASCGKTGYVNFAVFLSGL